MFKAHYDGTRIVLDEPFDPPINTPLLVTLLPVPLTESEADRLEWTALAAEALASAYSDDEPEYSVADLRKLP
jgi:hypothetical protein